MSLVPRLSFRERLKIIRKMREISQDDAAKQIGISTDSVSFIEQGRNYGMNVQTFMRICKWAKLDPNDFMDEFGRFDNGT